MAGSVEAIFIAKKGGEDMVRLVRVEAVAKAGLEGDRYMLRTGYWTSTDECQVTLIEGEELDRIEAESDIEVKNGQHRRNIVTRGIRLFELIGKKVRVGEAVLMYDRPRPPCGYIQSITQRGMTKALGGRRGGICVQVVTSGTIRVEDSIDMIEEGDR